MTQTTAATTTPQWAGTSVFALLAIMIVAASMCIDIAGFSLPSLPRIAARVMFTASVLMKVAAVTLFALDLAGAA